MIETIRNAWKIPDLRKKLTFVLFAVIVYRFAAAIYVPFVDTAALASQFLAANAGTSSADPRAGGWSWAATVRGAAHSVIYDHDDEVYRAVLHLAQHHAPG